MTQLGRLQACQFEFPGLPGWGQRGWCPKEPLALRGGSEPSQLSSPGPTYKSSKELVIGMKAAKHRGGSLEWEEVTR